MARFNALLQSLARPPEFQQGLFEAAKGLGMTPMLAEQEKLRKEQQAQFQAMIGGPPTLQKIADLRSMAAGMVITNPTRAEALNKAANGMQRQYDAIQEQRAQQLTGLASQIARDSSIGNIATHVDAMEGLEDWQKASLIKQASEQRKLVAEQGAQADARVLGPEYTDFIKDNISVFENNPAYQEAERVRNLPAGERNVGALVRANNTIKELVNAEQERQNKAQFKSAAVEGQATGFINDFITEDSVSEFIFGRDAVETAREVFADEDLKDDFVKFVGAEYEKQPNIDPQVAVKNALDFMGEKYSKELEAGRLANTEEQEEVDQLREDAIAFIMKEEDMSRKDAIRELNSITAESRKQEMSEETTTEPSTPVSTPVPTPVPTSASAPTPRPTPRGRAGMDAMGNRDVERREATGRFLSDLMQEAEKRRELERTGLMSGGRPVR